MEHLNLPLKRDIFHSEHKEFRQKIRSFIQRSIVPNLEKWEQQGHVDKTVFEEAARVGAFCPNIPKEFGGYGLTDFRYNAIIAEELEYNYASGVLLFLATDMVVPYYLNFASDEQKQRWLPGIAAGKTVLSVCMTEPGVGSDLANIRATAFDQGDHYVLNAQKTLISNGSMADLLIVVAQTDPTKGRHGISLLVVERHMEGFQCNRILSKMGHHARDVCELSFKNVKVPKCNVLGELGKGFIYLMKNLVQERLVVCVTAVAAMEAALNQTIDFCKSRKIFERRLGDFQYNSFKLAELKTEVQVARLFVDKLISEHVAGSLNTESVSMGKFWLTELQTKVLDTCVQFHGGWGYVMERHVDGKYPPIAKSFLNARVQPLYAGSNEVMKEIVASATGFQRSRM